MKKDNMELFNELRNKYSKFIYTNYEILDLKDEYDINFYYSIISENDKIDFCNKMRIYKKKFNFKHDINSEFCKNIVFNIGLAESISYYKLTCSKVFEVQCGYLNAEQINWWKKLIYNGLGELRYLNGIEQILIDEFVNFEVTCQENILKIEDDLEFSGNLIPIGGGKDSIVTIELLKQYDNIPFMFYHNRKASYDTCYTAGYAKDDIFEVDRSLDEKIFELNAKGYINGHVPISSMIAFASYLVAYLLGKKYIVLSNEASSNEGNIEGTNINHQYSKSYEFEADFRNYVSTYFINDIEYFSLLRTISEYQIVKQLIKYEKYLDIFRSCNSGIKENVWCCNCPKCLFVYSLLIPFLGSERTNKIFGKDLLDSLDLENDFRKLIGLEEEKPFECVGTKDELIFGLQKYIKKSTELPVLLQKYLEYIQNYEVKIDYDKYYNSENFVPSQYLDILKLECNI